MPCEISGDLCFLQRMKPSATALVLVLLINLINFQPVTHLQSVLAGTVAGGKRSSHDAHHTAHSDNLPFLPLDHVVQDILCQRDGAQVVELNDGIVDIQVGVHEQGALWAPTIVDQNINLEKDKKIN